MGSKKKNKITGGDEGDNDKGKGKQVIVDPRFSKVHSDPRFQKLPKHKAKVSIDKRFSGLLNDKRFGGSSAPFDKRGKPKKNADNAFRRYYSLEEDVEKENPLEKQSKKEKKIETDTDSSSASSDSDSDSEPDSDRDLDDDASTSTTDTDDGADMLEDDDFGEIENVPVIEKETHRLAVVNMDWNQVKAVDLFMMLSSFLPKEGQITSVAVYPSEFGLQRMQEEAVRGPAALFDDEQSNVSDDDDNEDEDEFNTEKLRAYEKSRLRYYYAVVECDSIATADYLYKACDGVEFERSSNVLDLRFIPDSMEFKHPPRDVATKAPTEYDGLDFHTRALQQSNVGLSWDDDEPHRVKTLRRKFNEKQLAELELKEFLASDESESDEDENDDDTSGTKEKKLEKYRALLQSGGGSEEDDDDGQDMEVTFNTGLEDLSQKILEKKEKGAETVWEAYLRKRSEKKKAKKHRSNNSSDDDSDESNEEHPEQADDFFEEPTAERTKKAGHLKKNSTEMRSLQDKAAEASRAELELLLADEKGADEKVKGYKMKKKKGKKDKEAPDEDKLLPFDDDDSRFSALFSNPGFALDPTDPQFKRSATYFRQLAQRQNKGREGYAEGRQFDVQQRTSSDLIENQERQSVDRSKKEKHELSSIVKSLKMKSQQVPVPSAKSKNEKMRSNGSSFKEKKHKLSRFDSQKKKKAKV